jgi:hypothetical protein
MSESLKAQRERVATEICTATPAPCPACLKDLRELQRAAIERVLEAVGYVTAEDAAWRTGPLPEWVHIPALLDREPRS